MSKFNNQLFGRPVVFKEHENINQALRRFKRKVEDSGVHQNLLSPERCSLDGREEYNPRCTVGDTSPPTGNSFDRSFFYLLKLESASSAIQ